MKVTFEFSKSRDDTDKYLIYRDAQKWADFAKDFYTILRNRTKYAGDDVPQVVVDAMEELKENFTLLLDDSDLRLPE